MIQERHRCPIEQVGASLTEQNTGDQVLCMKAAETFSWVPVLNDRTASHCRSPVVILSPARFHDSSGRPPYPPSPRSAIRETSVSQSAKKDVVHQLQQ